MQLWLRGVPLWNVRPGVATGFTRIAGCSSVPAIGRRRWWAKLRGRCTCRWAAQRSKSCADVQLALSKAVTTCRVWQPTLASGWRAINLGEIVEQVRRAAYS